MDSPTVLRRRLGSELRELRNRAGLTGKDVADALDWSASKVSRIESGEVGLRERDVRPMLALYGVSDPNEIKQLTSLARKSRQPGWWQSYGDALPEWFKAYVGLEEDASAIRTYESELVPGLLQTEEYFRAVVRATVPVSYEEAADAGDRRIALRMQRQEILSRPNPPLLWAIINEAVLRRPVGSPEVMRAQLEHLADVADARQNVMVQVLPFSAGAHPAMTQSFSLLSFKDIPGSIVYSESPTSSTYTEKPADTEYHQRVFDRLMASAVQPEKSVLWLRDVAKEYMK
ncbi:helix-turn-helix domain-containing protein [Kitasatospora viridis]|uniref:Helix-turn-helix protein n=1 Tax=Kitasatospora viridis TaxID=281105 RepID=A0A561UBC3_9ACTN|nr:helix-turn-helix transcriptional regulator [Kitasatospora viridis]TWF96658.1 helix-turn-helix protein [Kitasatospora viridis]